MHGSTENGLMLLDALLSLFMDAAVIRLRTLISYLILSRSGLY